MAAAETYHGQGCRVKHFGLFVNLKYGSARSGTTLVDLQVTCLSYLQVLALCRLGDNYHD